MLSRSRLRTVASAVAALTRADEFLVVEAHQEIAGDDLVVERNQHLGDPARHLRAIAHLAADRLDAARRRGCPAALGAGAFGLAERVDLTPSAVGLGASTAGLALKVFGT